MAVTKKFFTPKTEKDFEELYSKIKEAWWTEKPTSQIAQELNISNSRLYLLSRDIALPPRTHVKKRLNYRKDISDPSPEEIEQRAAAIQATWTDEERENRRVTKTRPVILKIFVYDQTKRDFLQLNIPALPESEQTWQPKAVTSQS